MCGTCIEHRGANAEMVLRRAQDHENMLRSRCKEARKAANSLEERMKSALRSREGDPVPGGAKRNPQAPTRRFLRLWASSTAASRWKSSVLSGYGT